MKRFELPPWHRGHCLAHAAFWAVDRLADKAQPLTLSEWCLDYDEGRWMWPGTAVRKMREYGLSVRVFDNDVDLRAFASKGLSCISNKYGKAGEAHLRRHFVFGTAIKDTRRIVSDPSVTIESRQMMLTDIKKSVADDHSVCLLNLDFRMFHDEAGPPIGHYVIPIGMERERVLILDPAFPKKVFRKTAEDILSAQNALRNETISLVISRSIPNRCRSKS